jgi:hypothetical protein
MYRLFHEERKLEERPVHAVCDVIEPGRTFIGSREFCRVRVSLLGGAPDSVVRPACVTLYAACN